MFDTLVISGGSVRGFGLLGAVQRIYEYHSTQPKCFIGTSIGSIIGYLLAIGYTPLEIVHSIHKSSVMEKIRQIEIISIFNNKGLFKFEPILEELESLTLKKTNKLYTLKELFEEKKKELICVTFNYSRNRMEILDRIQTPDLPCLAAIRMSSSLPFVFDRFFWGECIYVDGGICDNFPIQVAHKLKKKNIIGVVCKESAEKQTNSNTSLIDFILVNLFFPIVHSTEKTVRKYKKRYPIVEVPVKNNFLNFNLSITDIMDMFSSGYNSITPELLTNVLKQKIENDI